MKLINIFNSIKKLRDEQNSILTIVLSQIFIFVLSIITVIMMNYVSANSLSDTFTWIGGNVEKFILSVIIYLIINQCIYLMTLKLYVPLLVSFPISIFAAFINYTKTYFRGEPFIASDLSLIKEALNISKDFNIIIHKEVFFSIAIFFVFLISALFIKNFKAKIRMRLLLFVLAIIITIPLLNITVVGKKSFLSKIIKPHILSYFQESKFNSFFLFFIKRIEREYPKDYSKETSIKYAKELNYSENIDYSQVTDDMKPNVIVIMCESLWDANYANGIKLNIDPLASIRNIAKDNGYATLLSPTLGGGTSNTEYEFLTCKSTLFYPPSIIYYQLTNKQWSLAWYFRNLNYNTIAIHPYYRWFFLRNKVYPLLGFEQMYFWDNMTNNEINGTFVSDLAVSKEIIDKYEKFNDKPYFAFAVTMQNHGDYPNDRYAKRDVKITSNMKDIDLKNRLEVYFEGTKYGAEAFKYLTDYFKNVKRPTYIVMFGDHSPGYSQNINLYDSSNDGELTDSDFVKTFLTPVVLWSNTGKNFGNLKVLSPFMLAEELFNITSLPKPGYIKLLSNIKKELSGFTRQYRFNGENNITKDNSTDALLRKIRICQYDATIGKRYALNEFEQININNKIFTAKNAILGLWKGQGKAANKTIIFYSDGIYKLLENGLYTPFQKFSFNEDVSINLENIGTYSLEMSSNNKKIILTDNANNKYIYNKSMKVDYNGAWIDKTNRLLVLDDKNYNYWNENGVKFIGKYSKTNLGVWLSGDLTIDGIAFDNKLSFGPDIEYTRITSRNLSINKDEIIGDWRGIDNARNLFITFNKDNTYTFNNQKKKYYLSKNYIILEDFAGVFIKIKDSLVFVVGTGEKFVYKKSLNDYFKGVWINASNRLLVLDDKNFSYWNEKGVNYKGLYSNKNWGVHLFGDLETDGIYYDDKLSFGEGLEYSKISDISSINKGEIIGDWRCTDNGKNLFITFNKNNTYIFDNQVKKYYLFKDYILLEGLAGCAFVKIKDSLVFVSGERFVYNKSPNDYFKGVWISPTNRLLVLNDKNFNYWDEKGVNYKGEYYSTNFGIHLYGNLNIDGIFYNNKLSFGSGVEYSRIPNISSINKGKILGDWRGTDNGKNLFIRFNKNNTYIFNNQIKKYYLFDNCIILEGFPSGLFIKIKNSLVFVTGDGQKLVYDKSPNDYFRGVWINSNKLLVLDDKNFSYWDENGINYKGNYSVTNLGIFLLGDLKTEGLFYNNKLSFGTGIEYSRVPNTSSINKKAIIGDWRCTDNGRNLFITFNKDNTYLFDNQIRKYYLSNNYIILEGLPGGAFVNIKDSLVFVTGTGDKFVYSRY